VDKPPNPKATAPRFYSTRTPFPRRDEPKTAQPPYVVVERTSIRFNIPGHISQYCKPSLLFLTYKEISDILNIPKHMLDLRYGIR